MSFKRVKRFLRRFVPPAPPPTSTASRSTPDWAALIAEQPELWRRGSAGDADDRRVLIATYVGGHPQFTAVETAIGVALTLRGVKVDILLCDEVLPGCLRAKIAALEPEGLAKGELRRVMCKPCFNQGKEICKPLNIHRVGEHLTEDDVEEARKTASELTPEEIPAFTLNGWPLGEHALAGALRYYGRGDLDPEPLGTAVLRRYLEASMLSARSLDRLLARYTYRAAVMNHGIYVPHGIAAAVCRSRGVRIATWNIAYRKQCVIFSHDDTYHHTLLQEPTAQWEGMTWSPKHEQAIMAYLETRQRGTNRDWIWFNAKPDDDTDAFAAREGLDWRKPVIGMLTNVIWDAQLHYPANAFPGMLDWVVRTISYFERRPDLQLVIRVHPGELAPTGGSTKSRQPMVDEIARAFPKRPSNVFVIPPESPLSTYAVMRRCNAVLIYGTKTGVELTSMGIPVIVAGEAWIRNKGLTLDASTADEYFRHLDRLPLKDRMDDATVRRARMYAYHFFFRRMIPLPFLTPAEGWPPFTVNITSLKDFLPGRYPGLDVICDGILDGKSFVYQAEHFGVHDG